MYNNRPMGLSYNLYDSMGQKLSTLGATFENLQNQDFDEKLELEERKKIKVAIVHLLLKWFIYQYGWRLDEELIEDSLMICNIIYKEIELYDFSSNCPFISLLSPFIFEVDILEKAFEEPAMGYVITILEMHLNTPRKAKELWEQASRMEVNLI